MDLNKEQSKAQIQKNKGIGINYSKRAQLGQFKLTKICASENKGRVSSVLSSLITMSLKVF